jgi:hypothetical protein
MPSATAAAGRVCHGQRLELDPAMNALTDLPAESPLAGLPNGYRTEFDWAKMSPQPSGCTV